MARVEPLAIVGMACRFPGGASGVDRFWELLEKGVDAICEVPSTRWDARKYFHPNPKKPGKAYVNQGGFLRESIDEFDPFFFHMSPREAESLDPQQRILLEVAFESIEDAGIPLAAIEGPRTGVFVGGFCLDANHLQLSALNRESIDSHTATSSSMAMLANRVSYVFNLQGPSITVDTACSSSLVATHLACQSLWNGECDLAIAGGANVMLRPEVPVTMCKGKFLSADGRCMTFDSRANGYVRGEGVGTVILKRLSHAQRDGDRIYAQVLATGINQDGRTSGITLPNGQSQAALMREVYAAAGVRPADIDYIEAHGTGTQAGDVTEATALDEVLSEGRPADRKVIVGSVKSNIGHLEAGAGIAGFIKAALVLNKQTVVPNLHFENPNPDIPFDSNCIRVPVEKEPLRTNNGMPRRVAINSFGYGGTNAHVLLQETVPPIDSGPVVNVTQHAMTPIGDRAGEVTGERIVCLSANGDAALKELSRKYVNWLKAEGSSARFDDVVFSMNQRRSHLDNRIAVRAKSVDDLAAKLRTHVKDGFCDGLTEGVVDAGKLVFVYTGMGPQWWAMGRQLLESEPVFADKVRQCDSILNKIAGWSMLEEMLRDEADSRIQDPRIAQAANVTIQVALTALWKSWGVVPDVVVGHSIGEVSAACASGALSLHDALLAAYHRSRLQATRADTGKMLAVGLGEADARACIAEAGGQGRVSMAAVNSPSSVTLAGDTDVLERIEQKLEADGIFVRFLAVDVPYHSHQMDPIRDELIESLASLAPQETEIPLYSTVTGSLISGMELDGSYWWRNVREPVCFAQAMSLLIGDGFRHFVEIGPHPVLQPSIRQSLSEAGKKGYMVQSLNRKQPDERGTILDSLATLHTLGIPIDLARWSDPQSTYVQLPRYGWQREKYWRESSASIRERFGHSGPVWFYHDLKLFRPAWQVELSPAFFPYLDDHVVQGNVVFPGAAYVEAGLEINRKLTERNSCVLENISFLSMLAVAPDKVQNIQLHYDEDSRYYSVHGSLNDDHDRWALHAKGRIVPQEVSSLMESHSLDELKSRCPEVLDPDQQYGLLQSRGLHYGPAFRTIRDWRRGDREVLVRLQVANGGEQWRSDTLLHPTILDGAFQSMVALFDRGQSEGKSFVPIEIEKLLLYAPVGASCWAYSRILHSSDSVIEGEIDLIGESGEILATVKGAKCKSIAGASMQTAVADCRYAMEWVESPAIDADDAQDRSQEPWLVLSHGADAQRWIQHFVRAGIDHTVVLARPAGEPDPSDSQPAVPGAVVIDPHSLKDFEDLLTQHAGANLLWLWTDRSTGTAPPHRGIADAIWTLNLLIKASRHVNADPLRITLLTERSHRVLDSDTDLHPSSSALHGFLPLISNELANAKTCLIDTDGVSNSEIVFRDLIQQSSETTVAIRSDQRYVQRLKRVDEHPIEKPPKLVSTADTNVELRITKPGSVESLQFFETERRAPQAGEIEIQVHASSLNFKDLLKVYGQLADNVIKDTFFGTSLGMEVSGVVVRVGEGVTDFQVGDEVAGPIAGSFCAFATVPTTYVVRRPGPLSFHETPVYIGYLAAYRGLVHVAELDAGEKILIHNATGGVGIAAIQIAKWKQAQIYATAGTKEKREYLRQQGIEHVYDSRSLLFAEQIRHDTDGYGVDVVINAIAGDALHESFDLLAPYGRFIEIGKKDIGDDNGLPMRAFNRNLTFAAVDMDRMLLDRVPVVQKILRDISDHFESGVFAPMPVSVFKASQAQEAFAFMAQSKHMGKVALEFKDDQVPVAASSTDCDQLDADGSYVITGGTSGFGIQVADWMARHGAGAVYLVSRGGVKNDDDQRLVDQMRDYADVYVRQVDITDPLQVEQLVAEIRAGDRPLKGMVHGAMVLDDAYLDDMTYEKYCRVLAPKIDGAWNLHHATQGDDLDLFIMFSSVSSLIGNAGQANYVAANSFLDGFAHYRRALGLPATTINWGVLSEAGVLARNADLGDALEVSGMKGFTNSQALAGLQMVLAANPVQIGLFDTDWSRVGNVFPALANAGTFRELIAQEGSGSSSNPQRDALIETLLPLTLEERQREVESRLLQTMSSVLKIPANRIDGRMNIADLGIDSLVAVELIVALQRGLGVEMTTVDLLGAATVSELASLLMDGLISDEDQLLANLDELSEAELDKLLSENAELVSSDH